MTPSPALAARDAAVRRAYAESGMTVAQLAEAIAVYFRTAWLRERALAECPVRHRGRIEAHFWTALRAWPHPLGREQLEVILAPAETPGRPLTPTERQRRWRRRQRADIAVIGVEVDFALIDRLIDRGYLAEAASEDKAALAAALRAVAMREA